MRFDGDTALCPFIGSDPLVIIDLDNGAPELHANMEHTAETICYVVLKTAVHRLVLGFLAKPRGSALGVPR
ncbi:hypothetical protein ACVOMV_26215 (plasmid) [Mesorhizobium atlanticum]|uniref:hypothetical protein n=1 Tax=Mesorhizobium atlanticum TaxID=2233532 RepID=UPI003703BA8C